MRNDVLIKVVKRLVYNKKANIMVLLFLSYLTLMIFVISDQAKVQLLSMLKAIPLVGILINGAIFELIFYSLILCLFFVCMFILVAAHFLPCKKKRLKEAEEDVKQEETVKSLSLFLTSIFSLGLLIGLILSLYFKVQDLFNLNYWMFEFTFLVKMTIVFNLLSPVLILRKKKFYWPWS